MHYDGISSIFFLVILHSNVYIFLLYFSGYRGFFFSKSQYSEGEYINNRGYNYFNKVKYVSKSHYCEVLYCCRYILVYNVFSKCKKTRLFGTDCNILYKENGCKKDCSHDLWQNKSHYLASCLSFLVLKLLSNLKYECKLYILAVGTWTYTVAAL